MAIQTEDLKYIRISKENLKQSLENILINTYKNKEIRDNPSEFDIAPQTSVKIEIGDEYLNKIVTDLYVNLKSLPEFQNTLDI